jgi:hypothetical protein
VFGGLSSRFWMLRKYINSLTNKELSNIPFYSWNCITINLEFRDIDIVIRNEKHMMNLIRFLIMVTQTVDGRQNTGSKILKTLNL